MVVPVLSNESDYIRTQTVYIDAPAINVLLQTGRLDGLIREYSDNSVRITSDAEKLWVAAPQEVMEEVLHKLEEAILQTSGCGLEINIPIDLQNSLKRGPIPVIQEKTKTWIRLPMKGSIRPDEIVVPGFINAKIFGALENCRMAEGELFNWMRRRRIYFKSQYHHEMYLRLLPLFTQMSITISPSQHSPWPSIHPTSPLPPPRPTRHDIYLYQRHRRWTKNIADECLWVIEAKDEAGARRACEIVDETLREICGVSHRGVMVFPVGWDGWDAVGRVLKGEEKERVQREVGVVVDFQDERGCIVIVGSEINIEVARKKILDLIGASKLKRVDVPLIQVSES